MTEEENMADATAKAKKPARRPARPTAGPKGPTKSQVKRIAAQKEPEPVMIEEPEVKAKPIDILMWIGCREFKTIDDFESAVWDKGIVDKISKAPKGFIPGKSRVFLAHDEGNAGDGVIFGYYIPKVVQLVVDEDGKAGDRKRKVPRYVKKVKVKTFPPGTMLLNLHKPDEETLVIFEYGKTRDYNVLIDKEAKRFRGYKIVDGDLIVSSELVVKSSPGEHMDDLYHVEVSTNPLPHQRWTPEEDATLLELVTQTPTKAQAFQVFARKTDRTELGVSYHYYRLMDKAAKEAKDGSPSGKKQS